MPLPAPVTNAIFELLIGNYFDSIIVVEVQIGLGPPVQIADHFVYIESADVVDVTK
jgi:hypothetical protein